MRKVSLNLRQIIKKHEDNVTIMEREFNKIKQYLIEYTTVREEIKSQLKDGKINQEEYDRKIAFINHISQFYEKIYGDLLPTIEKNKKWILQQKTKFEL